MNTPQALARFLSGLFLWLPLAVLAALSALCLKNLPGKRRVLAAVLSAAALCGLILFGGEGLLALNGLTWRAVPKLVLGGLLWLLGLAAGVLTVVWTGWWMGERLPKLELWGVWLTLYCLVSVMLAGTVLGGLWAVLPDDRTVGTWQGSTVVQGAGFFHYELYEYHGPLIRGRDPLARSEGPMLEESILREREWVLSNAGKNLGVDLTGETVLSCEDTHGGINGDGETRLTVAFERPPAWLEEWTPLPLTEDLTRAADRLAVGFFPDISEGRYFFLDRSAESADPKDGSGLFSRRSWNFILALYDTGENMLYYYKLDT